MEALLEKVYAAEKAIAWVRAAVIVINTLVYLLLLERTRHELALGVIVLANLYWIVIVSLRPYESLPVLLSARFTVVLDAAFISIWLYASGGYASPFFLLWYLSAIGVAFRYGAVPTLVAATVYGLLDLVLGFIDGPLPAEPATAIVRVSYIFLVATVGALMSTETFRQTAAKVTLRSRASELDAAVLERTNELAQSRAELEVSLQGLRSAHERLKELDGLKTRFINNAAHEFSTPLTPVRMQLQLLRDKRRGPLNERQERSLDILDRNIDRLRHMVQEVLDVARLQNDRLPIEVEPVDVGKLVGQSVRSYEDIAKVPITCTADEAWTEGDGRRLGQVFDNLLHNAIKFTKSGSIQVTVTRQDADVVVAVADSGIGLSAKEIDLLFRPFVQIHHDTGGTGLGLFICKGIVQAHGGTLDAASDGPGRGTTFTVRLPPRPPDDAGTIGAPIGPRSYDLTGQTR